MTIRDDMPVCPDCQTLAMGLDRAEVEIETIYALLELLTQGYVKYDPATRGWYPTPEGTQHHAPAQKEVQSQ